MESIYQSFNHVVPGVSGQTLFWVFTAILVSLVVLAFVKTSSGAGKSKGVVKTLQRISADSISNVVIRDEVDGYIPIDYLCLTASGICVVDIKDYRGLLFGGATTDQWTQVIDNRSYKFDNPLYQNKARVHAIKIMLNEEIPVFGCVVFTNAGKFPKDKPEGVHMQDVLEQELKLEDQSQIPEKYKSVWAKLKETIASLQPSESR